MDNIEELSFDDGYSRVVKLLYSEYRSWDMVENVLNEILRGGCTAVKEYEICFYPDDMTFTIEKKDKNDMLKLLASPVTL